MTLLTLWLLCNLLLLYSQGCETENAVSFAIALNEGPVTTAYDTVAGQYEFIYTGTMTPFGVPRSANS